MTDRRPYSFTRPAPRLDPAGPYQAWPLEASAGTGKTWTIENLVADYLADGEISVEEVAIVTFTRAAANELRSRVRSNLDSIVRGARSSEPHRDYNDEERRVLRDVVESFDLMAISTIHGFAHKALGLLGDPVGGLSDPSTHVPFRRSVIHDVVRGLDPALLAPFADGAALERLLDELLMTWSNNPAAELVASLPTPATDALITVARQCRSVADARKVHVGVADFGDLLTRLAERLRDPRHAETIATTYRVLLIDEFQDTDSLQVEIFQRLCETGRLKAFVVVGDPKQAIYGFRGGDVQVYREAVPAGRASYLTGNRRSSRAYVEGANEFFSGVNFGFTVPATAVTAAGYEVADVDIDYVPVTAEGPLRDQGDQPAWFFRFAHGTKADDIQRSIRDDLAAYISALVRDDVLIDPRDGRERPVTYGDICILARSNEHVSNYVRTLRRAGLPVTVVGSGQVFDSPAAVQWRQLLAALRQPSAPSAARLAASTWFGATSLNEIVLKRDDPAWLGSWSERLHRWRALFESPQRAELPDQILLETDVLTFLSSLEGAARSITDLVHVAEIVRSERRASLLELDDILAGRSTASPSTTASVDESSQIWSRRLDSDRPAVRVMTIHQSKGLEFPIVLVPYLSASAAPKNPVVAYRAMSDGLPVSVLDVTATGKTPGAAMKKLLAESELQRNAYVALTRAQSRVVLWTWDAPKTKPAIRDHAWRAAHGDVGYPFAWDDRVADGVPEVMRPTFTLARAPFERHLPTPLSRVSYSSLTSSVQLRDGAEVAGDSEPDGSEGTPVSGLVERGSGPRGSALLGTVVHRSLQGLSSVTHPTPEDIRASVVAAASESGLVFDEPGDDVRAVTLEAVSAMVHQTLTGEFGEVAPGDSLATVGAKRWLAEVGFDFTTRGVVRLADVVEIAARHLHNDPLFSSWLAQLDVDESVFRGMITGSIDAVVAVGDDTDARFLVLDFKTNNLGPVGPDGYDPTVLRAAMSQHHYQLQALLYLVALHRYLRQRLGSRYDYERHVLGAAYLFVRSMVPGRPGSGVLTLRPPAACIEELSELLEARP